MRLQGRVAVITGGGKGIGRYIAVAYAREGARVALAARSVEAMEEVAAEIRQMGGEVLTIPTDVADEGQVRRMAEATMERFGRIEILVNNSGIPGPTRKLWEIEPAEWDEVMAVNVRGPYLCCRAVIPQMIQQQWGRIINISSILGRAPMALRSPYTTSKLGLVGITQVLAQEVGPENITVNLISPGAVAGDRLDLVMSRAAQTQGVTLEEFRKRYLGSTPLRRFIQPEDIAEAAVFLASDAAANITGEDLNVTGGRAMW